MYLCSLVLKLWQMSVFFLHIDTGVILIGDAILVNQYLVLAEIKGCQVTDWIAAN